MFSGQQAPPRAAFQARAAGVHQNIGLRYTYINQICL
jgi:hypothetical protein